MLGDVARIFSALACSEDEESEAVVRDDEPGPDRSLAVATEMGYEFETLVVRPPDWEDRQTGEPEDSACADSNQAAEEEHADANGCVAPAAELLDSLSDSLATPAESRLIVEMRKEMAAELEAAPQFPELVGDIRMLRALRCAEHQVVDAAAALRKHLGLRQTYGLNDAREHIVRCFGDRLWGVRAEELPYGESICGFLPEVLVFSRAKNGNPVSLVCWGKHKPQGFIGVNGWEQKFRVYMAHLAEWRALLLDQASRSQERVVHFVNIYDLQGFSMLGSLDSEWTSFQSNVASELNQSYQDFNSHFFFLRTTIWAKGAYNMFLPLIPESVRRKTVFLGDDFEQDEQLQTALDEAALDALARRDFGDYNPSKSRIQEGCVTISANDAFELPVEVPADATLSWDFKVQGGEIQFSLWRPANGIDGDRSTPIECWEPVQVSGEGFSGRLRKAGEVFCCPADGPRQLILRWDNTGAWWWSRTVNYHVQVLPPQPAESLAKGVRLPACFRVVFSAVVVVGVAMTLRALDLQWELF